MTERARFLAVMRYEPRDRCPICDFGFWPETIEEWHSQGLPKWVQHAGYDDRYTSRYFGMDRYWGGPWVNADLCPGFEEKVIEDRGDQEVVQQGDGVRVLRQKRMGSIPRHLGHLLEDRESWEKHYLPRLQPGDPKRLPADWDAAVRLWTQEGRPTCAVLSAGSLYGRIRDWMGMENLSYLVYDDPGLFEEMVDTLAEVSLSNLRAVYATGAQIDALAFWEDMCYSGGPLLPPEVFAKVLVPRYRKITDLARAHGTEIAWVDCDGKIDALIPLWLEAGVNTMFPLEVGTWGADPVKYRGEYGRELLLMGGFDKHILAGPIEGIEREVERLAPLVEEGGYLPFPDHRVPPDVPLAHYMAYLHAARRVWGKGNDLHPLIETEP